MAKRRRRRKSRKTNNTRARVGGENLSGTPLKFRKKGTKKFKTIK